MTAGTAITIPGHVHGYPDLAFGGYVAGMLAERVGGEVRVDFRRGVPVEAPVLVTDSESGSALVDPDGTVLAEASPGAVELAVTPPPSWDEAVVASRDSFAAGRPIPDCYGCGTANPPGRGLRLYPWRVRAHDLVAAAWIPDPELAGPGGHLTTENIWSAVDCPGGWAAIDLAGMRPGGVTAALTTRHIAPVHAGAKYLVWSWPIAASGRKYTVGVAISTPGGDLAVLAEALWIEPRH
ncbi:hotdog fold domain-containing protein [Nocardia sp. NPDC052254]|uniref:hotdog fold domain-containing protein n=1 Tax=Nocardia sp. NPDC052254 TaxID=3155681 RepID=UPI003442307A